MKTKITPLQRISGIFAGIAVVLLIFVVTVTGIFKNKYFYLSQNERYQIATETELSNVDEYTVLYKNLISVFSGKKAENDTVLLSNANVKSMMLYSYDEVEMLNKISKTFKMAYLAYVPTVLAAALVVVTALREKRSSLKGIGIYMIVFGVIGVVAVNILSFTVSPSSLVGYFTAAHQGSLIKKVFTENFFTDYLVGTRRFYDFLSLIPIGIGYLLIKFSKKKNYTPDGEYMYQ